MYDIAIFKKESTIDDRGIHLFSDNPCKTNFIYYY